MADYCVPGEINSYVPKASTQITVGDVVVAPTRRDPFSRARLGSTIGRILPIASADSARWSVGVAAMNWKVEENGVTNTLYATPTTNSALKVYRTGVFKMRIVDTTGYKGDYVRYSSGATGAQLLKIDNYHAGWAIGRIFEDFSSATANDEQMVELIAKPLDGIDYYFWLENRTLAGCRAISHSETDQKSSQVHVGYTAATKVGQAPLQNKFLLQGRLIQMSRKTDVSAGRRFHLSAGASKCKFYWVMGRSATIAIRTCSGRTGGVVTWTNSGVTMGAMIPKTYTSGEVPLNLICAWSTTKSLLNSYLVQKMGPAVPRLGNWRI